MYSILGGRFVGIGLEKLSLYHATLNIPSPSSRFIYSSAQRDILVGIEQVARENDRATTSSVLVQKQTLQPVVAAVLLLHTQGTSVIL